MDAFYSALFSQFAKKQNENCCLLWNLTENSGVSEK